MILITGATGGLGQQIVRLLLERNASIRLLVRNTKKARKIFGDNVELVSGDTRRPETLLPALEGIHKVINSTGTRMPIGANSPETVDFIGVGNLVKAASTVGVKRFLLVSSIAVTKPDHPLNKFGKVLDWKLKGENILRQSGLTYTIIRPGGLTDGSGRQNGLTIDQGDRISGTISRADVAEVCIQAIDRPETRNTTFEIIASPGNPITDWDLLFSGLKPDLMQGE